MTMRTEQELNDNLAKYWRRMNRAFGVADGTHPEDPNPKRESDGAYRVQPEQVYADPVFPPYEDVYAALIRDPHAVAIFRDHWDDVFKPHDFGPLPPDATGQLRWYIMRDLNEYHHKRHKIDFADAKKHRTRQRVEEIFAKLSGIDPLFTGTVQVMDHHVRHLPPSAQQAVREMFSRCPHEALDFYKEMRASAGEVANIYHGRRNRRKN